MNSRGVTIKSRELLANFYLGRLYPVFTGALVFVGHALAVELYLNLASMILTSMGLVITKKARPLIFFAISFIFQVSAKNSPGIPEPSNYYFTSYRLWLFVIPIVIFISALIYYSISVRLFLPREILKIPLLIPLIFLSLAFILNGAFSDGWNVQSLIYGALEAVCFAGLFVFFFLALRREREGLVDYFVFCSAVLAAVICLEVLLCYIKVGNPTKESLLFGWGIWNTAGVSLTVLLPTSLLGFAKGRARYLSIFVLTFICVMLTMSRNAMLTGLLVAVLSLLVMLLYGKRRRVSAFVLCTVFLFVIAACATYGESVNALLSRFFDDNGRFLLWRAGLLNFLSSPAFGVGFFGADFGTFFTADFLPTMAHQTFVQLLSAMGIFGLAAYLLYRGATILPFVLEHSFDKTMLALSALALLFESLIDNFIFFFSPTIHYTVLMAIVFVLYSAERTDKQLTG